MTKEKIKRKKIRKKLRNRIWRKYRLQTNFAKAAGVDDAVISNILNYRRPFTKQRQEQWAELLNCRPQDLVD